VEHKSVLQGLEFECVVDVGANRGQFALISHRLFPKAKIYSFEPLQEPARIFEQVLGKVPNMTLFPFAVGPEKTTAAIHVTRDDDSSSLLPVMKVHSSMFPGTLEKETRQVAVLPLSEALAGQAIPPASLLKIDVQGFELEVLKGCENLLRNFSHLYIECSFVELYQGQALAHQVISWLERRDFILRGVYNLYYAKEGGAMGGDFLFVASGRRGIPRCAFSL